MKRLCLILLAGLLAFPGCGGEEGKDCGQGTVEVGGECVPLIVDCAPGTRQDGFECVPMCPSGEVWDGNQCVPAAERAPGTVLQGDQCVPACGTDQYWDGTACADLPECDTGTVFNPQTGMCEIDETVCASVPVGTHFMWHILNALMLSWMIEVYRRHELGVDQGGLAARRAGV